MLAAEIDFSAVRAGLERHVGEMRGKGFAVHAESLGAQCAHGVFLAPTLIEISSLAGSTRC